MTGFSHTLTTARWIFRSNRLTTNFLFISKNFIFSKRIFRGHCHCSRHRSFNRRSQSSPRVCSNSISNISDNDFPKKRKKWWKNLSILDSQRLPNNTLDATSDLAESRFYLKKMNFRIKLNGCSQWFHQGSMLVRDSRSKTNAIPPEINQRANDGPSPRLPFHDAKKPSKTSKTEANWQFRSRVYFKKHRVQSPTPHWVHESNGCW